MHEAHLPQEEPKAVSRQEEPKATPPIEDDAAFLPQADLRAVPLPENDAAFEQQRAIAKAEAIRLFLTLAQQGVGTWPAVLGMVLGVAANLHDAAEPAAVQDLRLELIDALFGIYPGTAKYAPEPIRRTDEEFERQLPIAQTATDHLVLLLRERNMQARPVLFGIMDGVALRIDAACPKKKRRQLAYKLTEIFYFAYLEKGPDPAEAAAAAAAQHRRRHN